jgi:hypothetical protein
MRPEDFEEQLQPKPAPPGQGELFDPGPAQAKAKAAPQPECPIGTMSLLDLLESEQQQEE